MGLLTPLPVRVGAIGWMPKLLPQVVALDKETRGRRTRVTARELEDADRAAAWALMLRTWPNYAKHEELTDRLIPVFRLEPRP